MSTETFTNTNETPVQFLGDFLGSTEDTSQSTNTGLDFVELLPFEL